MQVFVYVCLFACGGQRSSLCVVPQELSTLFCVLYSCMCRWIHTVNTVLLSGFLLFLFTYECIRGVCAYLYVCECNIRVCAYMCTCMERPKLALDIFLDCSPLYLLR